MAVVSNKKMLQGALVRVKYVLVALSLIYVLKLTIDVRPSLSPIYRMRVKAMDTEARDIWTDYITTHPVEADERYAFREMGFRANAYAELARMKSWGRLEALEESLWSYAPRAAEIRRKALARYNARTSTMTMSLSRRIEEAPERGIVMIVRRDSAMSALQSISMLRNVYNCDLPVEVYFHTEDELPMPMQLLLQHQGNVKTFDIKLLPYFGTDLEDDAGRYPGMKETGERMALAMLASEFQQMIVVEPHVVFLQDPTKLFDHPSFQKTGTLFFRSKAKPADKGSQYLLSFIKRQFDQGSPSSQLRDSPFWRQQIASRQDTAVVALDKGRPGVLSALFMNAWSRRRMARQWVWGPHLETMNEALWLSFEVTNVTYAFENSWPGAIGRFDGDWEDDRSPAICSSRTLQFLSPANGRSSSGSYSILSPFTNPDHHPRGHKGGEPFWFENSLLISPREEKYYTPNVYTRHLPYVDRSRPNEDCLEGATLRKLQHTDIPNTLQQAITAAHHVTENTRQVVGLYAQAPRPAPPTEYKL
ncbi:hypothetical protein BCV70DRAFT_198392 [Testicularia cyperi]|uniref:Uncharacterized protein n=1 Tax=Testicularia cyperi TaxID=1882483 RepID=A0A317XVJ7_9BASI|nr:hypothetical protein BCV70DRAFT_198392 [Testicularia cyperi]